MTMASPSYINGGGLVFWAENQLTGASVVSFLTTNGLNVFWNCDIVGEDVLPFDSGVFAGEARAGLPPARKP
jgi:hypothetical protein